MLLAIINGFLLDRVRFHLLLVPEYLVAGLGFLLLTLVDSPISASGRFLLIVASTSAISSNVIASIMIIKSIREHARGTILGFYVFSGSIGVLIMAKVGVTFDTGGTIPFAISGGLAVAYALIVAILIVGKCLPSQRL